jgi:class 3 adenylate cyclase
VRVDRSFAFMDLSGFTAFTETVGDQEAVRLLSSFRTIVRDVVAEHAVRVDKWLGDGVMLVSVEPEPLIRAVLGIEHRFHLSGLRLPLRSGVARGDVLLLEGDDYIGTAVNTAARLCALADPRQVLAASSIVDACPPEAEALAAGVRRIRGIHEPVRVFDLRLREDLDQHGADTVLGGPAA